MVVRDRLKEMQEASPHCVAGEDVEIEMKPLKGKEKAGADGMATFLVVAEEINGKVDEVKKNVEDMRKTQRLIISEPSRAERDKHQARHSDLVDANKHLGRRVQKLIKEEQEKLVALEEKGKHSSQVLNEIRLKRTQIQTASNRFLEIWTEYNTLQVQFREKVKEDLVKCLRVTNNQLTEEEIEEKIDAGEGVFSASIMQETAQAKEQLARVENRHKDIKRLEEGITEIHSMFMDLAMLVEQQGEMVTRIEDHINTASIDVEKGRENLSKAETLQKSARKKKVILGILAVVVVLILLLVILSEFGAFSGGGGETKIIERTNYIYVMPDGTKKEFDEPQKNLEMVPSSPTTIVTESAPSAASESEGYEGSAPADEWEWEEGFQEEGTKPTPPP